MAIDEELALDAAGQLKQRFAEALQIRARWHIRRQLFGSQPAFELLAAVAPAFFGFVREASHDDLVMSVSRLTDPARTGKYENGSLGRLCEAIIAIDPINEATYTADLRAIQEAAAPIRRHRDKRVAHTALNPSEVEIDDIPIQAVDDTLRLTFTFLDRVNTGLGGEEVFAPPASQDPPVRVEGNEILQALARARAADELLGLEVLHERRPPETGLSAEGASIFRKRWRALYEPTVKR